MPSGFDALLIDLAAALFGIVIIPVSETDDEARVVDLISARIAKSADGRYCISASNSKKRALVEVELAGAEHLLPVVDASDPDTVHSIIQGPSVSASSNCHSPDR